MNSNDAPTSEIINELYSNVGKSNVEAKIEAGIASGESSAWTKDDLEAVKAEIRYRHAQRQESRP